MQSQYQRAPVSNGNVREQALIRRWWYEECASRGELVWEYYIRGYYVDAVWFPESAVHGVEHPGKDTGRQFPISGSSIVLCEAKVNFTPELIGQAVVYRKLLEDAGANVVRAVVFSERGNALLKPIAEKLGLEVYDVYAQQIAEPDA